MYTQNTLKLIGIYVSVGYCCKGTPFKWGKAGAGIAYIRKAEPLGFFIWMLSVLLSICITLGTVSNSVIQLRIIGLETKNLEFVILFVGSFRAVLLSLFHINLAHKRHEFVKSYEQAIRVFRSQGSNTTEQAYMNTCELSMLALFVFGIIVIPLVLVFLYFGQCQFHILCSAGFNAWVCSSSEGLIYSGMKKLFLALLQYIYVISGMSSAFAYVALGFPYLFYHKKLFDSLISRFRNNKIRVKKTKELLKMYREFQMVHTHVYECLNPRFLIGLFTLMTVPFILTMGLLVKTNYEFNLGIVYVSWIIMYMTHFVTAFKQAAWMPEYTGLFIKCLKSQAARSKIMSKLVLSYRPVLISFGVFGNLDKPMYYFIVTNGIALIVNFTVSI